MTDYGIDWTPDEATRVEIAAMIASIPGIGHSLSPEEAAQMAQVRRADLIHDIHTSSIQDLWDFWNIHWMLIKEEPFGYYDAADYGGMTVGEYAERLFQEMCERGL